MYMKKASILIFALLMGLCGLRAQKIYSTNYKSEADVKVYVTEYRSEADLIVYKTKYTSEATDNNVEVYISFLRKKLDFVKSRVEIVSLRKIGYRLEVRAE